MACDPWDRLPVTVTGVPPSPIQYSKPSDQCPQTQSSPPATLIIWAFYTAKSSTLCLCRLQLAKQSIKRMGELPLMEGNCQEVRGGVLWNLTAYEVKASRRHNGGPEFVTARAANWEFFMARRFETCCSCEFLKSSLCEVPKYFVLWHQFPRSATVVGLYITSARTIKLLWIFMTGLKDIFLCPPGVTKWL